VEKHKLGRENDCSPLVGLGFHCIQIILLLYFIYGAKLIAVTPSTLKYSLFIYQEDIEGSFWLRYL